MRILPVSLRKSHCVQYACRTGIVACQNKFDPFFFVLNFLIQLIQVFDVFGTCSNVFSRIFDVKTINTIDESRAGHELHNSPGTRPRHCCAVEA